MSDSISEVAGAGTLFGDETESSKKLSQRIKFAIFNFMTSIIGEEIIKFPFRYLFYMMELIQMVALCFSSQVNNTNKYIISFFFINTKGNPAMAKSRSYFIIRPDFKLF